MISFIKYLLAFFIGGISMYFYTQTLHYQSLNPIKKQLAQQHCIKQNKVPIEKKQEEDPNKDFYKFLDSYESESKVKPISVTTVYSNEKKSNSNSSKYTCDGRTYCSQMTSCEEATYFINHCPNTKMDGDGDGVPCWRQWCGH